MPPDIVTSVAMSPDDPRIHDRAAQLRLGITAMLDAVKSYNEENASPIKSIGLWTTDIWINRMDAAVAGEIIRSTYEQKSP